jgi:SAM-dependent methyltransferase
VSGAGALDQGTIERLVAGVLHRWDARAADTLATHGEAALLRQEARRIAATLALLDAAAPPARVLEIGTGYLTLAVSIRRRFPAARLVGVEHPGRSYVWTAEYRAACAAAGIRLVTTDLARAGLPFRAGAFDAAFFAEVVEHLPPDAVPAVLADLARVLRPGGALVLTTPNLAAWTNRELVLRGHSPQQSPARMIDGTYPHLRLYTMAELAALLDAAGFAVAARGYFDRVPVGVSPARRALTAALAPARAVWPALRETCALRAERRA